MALSPQSIPAQETTAVLSTIYSLPTKEALIGADEFFRNHHATKKTILEVTSQLPIDSGRRGFINYVLIDYQLPSAFVTKDPANDYEGAALFLADKIESSKKRSVADILLLCNTYGVINKHHIAYILSTAMGESRLQPERDEIGGLKYKFEPRFKIIKSKSKRVKKSYNTTATGGNMPCGDSLVSRGYLNKSEDVTIRKLYNDQVWPKADYEKRSEHFRSAVETCDFNNYAGRGYLQLTGINNYRKFDEFIEGDLVTNPALANERLNSAKILVIGMKNGILTGSKLSKYDLPHGAFNAKGARGII